MNAPEDGKAEVDLDGLASRVVDAIDGRDRGQGQVAPAQEGDGKLLVDDFEPGLPGRFEGGMQAGQNSFGGRIPAGVPVRALESALAPMPSFARMIVPP